MSYVRRFGKKKYNSFNEKGHLQQDRNPGMQFAETCARNVRSSVQKVSGLIYKSRAKFKMLWGIYSAVYGEVNVSVEKCIEIKGE